MRLGLTGAQGVGKSTLLREMLGWPEFNGYAFVSGITRGLSKRNGTPLNQQGTFEGQKTLIKTLTRRLKIDENLVVDRTLLDMYAYSCWMKEAGNITVQQLNYLRSQIRRQQHLFDIVFYIRPEFPVSGDDVRSGDQGFALAVAAEMERAVQYDQLGTKRIVTLTGAVEERLAQIKEAIHG